MGDMILPCRDIMLYYEIFGTGIMCTAFEPCPMTHTAEGLFLVPRLHDSLYYQARLWTI
jgi:hypothetical protein